MKLFTIGFTRKPAEVFFTRLLEFGVRRLADVRLNNVSQLAGFAKREDLRYFTKAICRMEYLHIPELAPTADMLDAFKKRKHTDWATYEAQFLQLMRSRRVEESLRRETLEQACLLCSEEKPHHCHRRLAAEYLAEKWGGIEVVHIP